MASPTLLKIARDSGYGFGWDLAQAMADARVSIRDLATWTGETQRRVRHVRAVGVRAFPFEVGFNLYIAIWTIVRRRIQGSERGTR